MNRSFSRDDFQMDYTCMKRGSMYLTVRKIQVKTTRRSLQTGQNGQDQDNYKSEPGEQGTPVHVWLVQKAASCYGKWQEGSRPQLPCDPIIPLLSLLSMSSRQPTHPQVYCDIYNSQAMEQPECPSRGEWTKPCVYNAGLLSLRRMSSCHLQQNEWTEVEGIM